MPPASPYRFFEADLGGAVFFMSGWMIAGCAILIIGYSMAEICSSYLTVGGALLLECKARRAGLGSLCLLSHRMDASRGYLRFLFSTVVHGKAIQSDRDLSMILDALLKIISRTVLIDLINKNGLQMLHNIMKRYRKEFIKTPILHKLLKVLEYLAMREILTLEHIIGVHQ